MQTLDDRITDIAACPREDGRLAMIVARPDVDLREVVQQARIEPGRGLVGDSWGSRPHPSPDAEITLMNVRCIAALAGEVERWPLAGDQLYVDLDLSLDNLPAGSRLRVGSVVLEVSPKPHTGCSKFSARFGDEAHAFVNSDQGRALRLRGLNARVVEGGTVHVDDVVARVRSSGDG